MIDYLSIFFFVLVLSAYFITLSPTIAGGDSGELVAEGCILGTPHPPGYPAYLIIVNLLFKFCALFELIIVKPSISVAFLVNISSAIFTSLSSLNIYYISNHFTDCWKCSLLSMGLFSFSPLIWQYAVTAEVFPLNTFLTSLLILTFLQFLKSRDIKYVLIGAFLCGLGLCNQHTSVLFSTPLILAVTYLIRNFLFAHPIYIGYIGAVFFCGLLPYAILPFVAILWPDGGSWGDVVSLNGFLHHFLRRDYGTFQLFSGSTTRENEGLYGRNIAYIQDLHYTQGLGIVPLLSSIGLLYHLATSIAYLITRCPKNTLCKSSNIVVIKKTETKQKTKMNYPAVAQLNDFFPDWDIQFLSTAILPLTLLFYLLVFHSLSNLPLGDRLLYGIHQRFWMQV
jgi:hypothetical protein